MQKHCRQKARERAAKGSRKVQKSVPTILVAWRIAGPLRMIRLLLTGLFRLSRPNFSKKTCAGTCRHVASPATLSTEVLPVLMLSSSVSLSINVHQIASGADVAERILAKGARKERERHTWPGKVVGHSGFYEKSGFAHAGREHH